MDSDDRRAVLGMLILGICAGLAVGSYFTLPGAVTVLLGAVGLTSWLTSMQLTTGPVGAEMGTDFTEAWARWVDDRPLPEWLDNSRVARIVHRDWQRRLHLWWPPTSRAKLWALWCECFWIYFYEWNRDGEFVRAWRNFSLVRKYVKQVGLWLLGLGISYLLFADAEFAAPLVLALVLVELTLLYVARAFSTVRSAEGARFWRVLSRRIRRGDDPEFLKSEIAKYKSLVQSQEKQLALEAAEKATLRAKAEAVMGDVPGLDRFVSEVVMPALDARARKAEKAGHRWDMWIALPVTVVLSVVATELFHRFVM